jgi:tyrosyl-DNA phosphodiesterase 2
MRATVPVLARGAGAGTIYAVGASIARPLRALQWMLRPRRSIPVGRFDTETNRWVDVQTAPGIERAELTLATYNVWFSDYWAVERYRAIATLLSARAPDVMVFQEVNSVALAEFLGQPWIRRHYHRAAAAGDDFGDYGMLMLSRLPITGVTYTRLPSRLGRGYLRAEFVVNGHPLVICCVHLESAKAAAPLRARQLARVFGALEAPNDVVVLGDFNMRDAEDSLITAPYVDVWPALRPDEKGFTEDTSINLLRWDSKPKKRHVRFDRILVKGTRWSPAAIELVGTEPISSACPRVFPSDHFGLVCRMVAGGG